MEQINPDIRRFFEEYERHTNLDDSSGAASQFAEVFMAADAAGARVLSTEALAAGIAKRKNLFEALGSRSTTLASLKARELSDRYLLAEADWRVRFDREEIGEIILRSSFVVHRSESGLKIVFYLMHQNPVAALKERGLLDVST